MKTPNELAAAILTSAQTHKKRATSLRRLAGGLRSEISDAESTGLTVSELKLLNGALTQLDHMATQFAAASKIAEKEQMEKEKRAKLVRDAMNQCFGNLSTITDRVAFVAAVNSNLIRNGSADTPSELNSCFTDCFGRLEYRLAQQAAKSSPQVVVDEAMAKFVGAKEGLAAQHKSLIERLARQS